MPYQGRIGSSPEYANKTGHLELLNNPFLKEIKNEIIKFEDEITDGTNPLINEANW